LVSPPLFVPEVPLFIVPLFIVESLPEVPFPESLPFLQEVKAAADSNMDKTMPEPIRIFFVRIKMYRFRF
jgi:hypothetical protein